MRIVLALVAGVAFLSTLSLLPVSRWLSFRLGAVDRPGGRKHHNGPIPCFGGLAVLGGLGAAMFLALSWPSGGLDGSIVFGARGIGLGGAAGALLVIGAMDDLGPVAARHKLTLELLLALGIAVWAFDVRAIRVGELVVGGAWGLVATGAVAFWIASVTNAYNMVDGHDGLAGGVGALGATAFAILGVLQQDLPLTLLATSVAASLLAFLTFNRPPARIFLGDVGSLPVGFLLAVMGVSALTGPGGTWDAVPALLILAFPAADITIAVSRRVLGSLEMVREERLRERFLLRMNGRSRIFSADRGHIHHRVCHLSNDAIQTLAICLGACIAVGALGVLSALLPSWWSLLPAGIVTVVALPLLLQLYPELRVLEQGLLLPLFDTRVASSRWTHALYDFCVAVGAFALTGWIVGRRPFDPGIGNVETLGTIGLVVVAVIYLGGVYRAHLRHMGLWQSMRTAMVTAVAGGAALLVGWWQMGSLASPAFAFVFLYLLLTAVVGARLSFRVLDAFHQRGSSNGRPTVIYGAGRGGHLVLRELLSNPSLELDPVAFLDDDPDRWHQNVEGYPVFGRSNGLHEMLRTQRVSDIIVSTEKISDGQIDDLAGDLARNGLQARILRFRWSSSKDQRALRVREEELPVDAEERAEPELKVASEWTAI